MKRKLKLIAGPVILIITATGFIWYLSNNPAVMQQLGKTPPELLAVLLVLYAGILLTLVGLLQTSLRLYQKSMALQENFLLNAYSSLVNFFGPGQSGPGFRAAYLKLKHNVKIKQYVFLTLLYYAFYAFFSGLLLFAAVRPWWQTALAAGAIAAGFVFIIRTFLQRNAGLVVFRVPTGTIIKAVLLIGLITLAQVLLVAAVYFVELRSLDSSIAISQVLAYTGAANFALFVALTPGAIGIREAFLLFSQDLHHIPPGLIVAANVLDRAVYVMFLGVLFLAIVATHATAKLQVRKVQQASEQADL